MLSSENDIGVNLFILIVFLLLILAGVAIVLAILRKFPVLNLLAWLGFGIAFTVCSFMATSDADPYASIWTCTGLLYATYLATMAPYSFDTDYDTYYGYYVEEGFFSNTLHVYEGESSSSAFWGIVLGGFAAIFIINPIVCLAFGYVADGVVGCIYLVRWLIAAIRLIREKVRGY